LAYSRKSITDEVGIERSIITSLITSTEFCKLVRKSIRRKYFQIDDIKVIVGWVLDYFDKYQKAPERHIRDIFILEKESLKRADAELIEIFLQEISDEYEQADGMNVNYLVDKAKDYFDKRSHEILFVDGKNLVAAGRIEEAKKLLDEHKGVIKDTGAMFDPFHPDEISSWDIEEKVEKLLRMPDSLGNLIGWLQRGWLLAVTAPEKRGKSWMLEEIAFQAIIAGLRVVFFSLEMNKAMLKKRLYKRLTGYNTKELRDLIYPVFDCLNNQDNSCDRKERSCNVEIERKIKKLGEKDGYIKAYDSDDREYNSCTWCRDNRDKINKKDKYNFETTYWFDTQKKVKQISHQEIRRKSKKYYSKKRGSNLRVRSFPSFSANSDDMKAELENLEYTEGFIPDVVIMDYFDIQKPERNSSFSERSIIDVIWKQGKNIADVMQCLVVTADQSNRGSRSKRSVEETDTTEDKRKDAHLDVRIALNQTPPEKEDGVMRINILFHRHRKFNLYREVMILQQLDLAQPLLDSEFVDFK